MFYYKLLVRYEAQTCPRRERKTKRKSERVASNVTTKKRAKEWRPMLFHYKVYETSSHLPDRVRLFLLLFVPFLLTPSPHLGHKVHEPVSFIRLTGCPNQRNELDPGTNANAIVQSESFLFFFYYRQFQFENQSKNLWFEHNLWRNYYRNNKNLKTDHF